MTRVKIRLWIMTVIGHNFVLFSQQKCSFLRQSDCFLSDVSLTSFLIMVMNWNCRSHVPVARLPGPDEQRDTWASRREQIIRDFSDRHRKNTRYLCQTTVDTIGFWNEIWGLDSFMLPGNQFSTCETVKFRKLKWYAKRSVALYYSWSFWEPF